MNQHIMTSEFLPETGGTMFYCDICQKRILANDKGITILNHGDRLITHSSGFIDTNIGLVVSAEVTRGKRVMPELSKWEVLPNDSAQ